MLVATFFHDITLSNIRAMTTITALLETFCNSEVPQIIKDVLVGNLLGDGNISISNVINGTFHFGQSSIHKEYIVYLFAIYSGYTTQSVLSFRSFVDSRSGNTHFAYNFSLKASPLLAPLYQLFYKNGVKLVRWECMYTLLTPRALAIWIMDDGQHVTRGGVTLCTDNLTFYQVLNLILVLEMKFGLVCSIHTKNYSNRTKIYYRIYISKTTLTVLQNLVSNYMHPSILYKIHITRLIAPVVVLLN